MNPGTSGVLDLKLQKSCYLNMFWREAFKSSTDQTITNDTGIVDLFFWCSEVTIAISQI
jgi:hypothetical protein